MLRYPQAWFVESAHGDGARQQREKQEDLGIAHTELASAPGPPFDQRLNELLEAERFDELVEGRCAKFYGEKNGRPSLTPGIYFRALLIGYFEGIGAERGIAWRTRGHCGVWWASRWTSTRRITRRFRARGG
ncbi:MAG: hypothetical protein WB660_13700 [Candidatus Sulfotelmatobacter sp.]